MDVYLGCAGVFWLFVHFDYGCMFWLWVCVLDIGVCFGYGCIFWTLVYVLVMDVYFGHWCVLVMDVYFGYWCFFCCIMYFPFVVCFGVGILIEDWLSHVF